MSIHREGYRFIFLTSFIWAILLVLTFRWIESLPWLFGLLHTVLFLFWFWVIWFFRVPKREMVFGSEKVICPADGKIVVIEEVFEPEFFKDNRLQVSIFMSPLNVHINRSPISGIIKFFKYHPGKYLVAWHPKSSTLNERTTMVVEGEHGPLLVRQIAGAVARRICYYVKEGQSLRQNDEYGFIRFGSRVDVFFPLGTKINVQINEVVKGGITVLGYL